MADKKITELPAVLSANISPGTDVIPIVTASDGITKKATLSDAVLAAVAGITTGVSSVNTRTGNVVLTSTDVGLANVNNTSDANKPVSTATQTALNLKANLTANTFSAAQEWATGANIASGATVNLDTATGNRVHITGTTTITAVTLTRGPRTVIFDGALTLTHNATTNSLPGGANITTAAGDVAIYEGDGTTVRCVSYTKASGLPIITSSSVTLLATLTPTVAANVDFLTTFSATCDNYLILGEGIRPGVDDALSFRFANAGVVDSGSNYITATLESNSVLGTGVAAIVLTPSNTGSAGKGANFAIHVMNANDASNFKTMGGKVQYSTAAGSYILSGSEGAYFAANAISGVRFFWGSGNNFAASGKIRIYGYSNT